MKNSGITRLLRTLLPLSVVALFASGCLIQDTTQTIYLEPDGSVTWSVLQRNVRSDEKRLDDRLREEGRFITDATAERHPIKLAFLRLNATDVRSLIVRAARPYTVLTEARFPQLDTLMEQFASAGGGRATSRLDRHDGVISWTLAVSDDDGPPVRDGDKIINALGDSFDGCRFVLTAGRFISADGFELSDDKRIATLRVPNDRPTASPGATLRFSLTWTDTGS
jgi:hypothetical protein